MANTIKSMSKATYMMIAGVAAALSTLVTAKVVDPEYQTFIVTLIVLVVAWLGVESGNDQKAKEVDASTDKF